jgi:molecular chaperone DnaJ
MSISLAQLTEDPSIRREGLELVSTVQLPYLKAILGGQVRVATLEGETDLHIPPGQCQFSVRLPVLRL